jgi:hypothetical protein
MRLRAGLELRHLRLRVYALKGNQTVLAWCRDAESNWETELAQEHPPEVLTGMTIDLSTLIDPAASPIADVYDPWTDRWDLWP